MFKLPAWQQIVKRFRDHLSKTAVRQWLIVVSGAAVLFAVLMVNYLPRGVDVEVGQVSSRDILAPRTAVHRQQTQRLQEEAAQRVVREVRGDPGYYKVSTALLADVERRVEELLNLVSELRQPDSEREPASAAAELEDRWQLEVSEQNLQVLVEAEDHEFADAAVLLQENLRAVMQSRISEEDRDEARREFREAARQSPVRPALAEVIADIGSQLVEPNLVLDTQRVEQLRQEAVRNVEPVTILQGEVILRRGDIVRPQHIQILQELGLHRSGVDFVSLAGLAVVVFMLVALLGVYVRRYSPAVLKDERQLALLVCVLVVVTGISKVVTLIEWPASVFLVPVALGGMLLTILLDSHTGIIAAVVLSLIAALLTDFNIVATIVALTSGLAAVFSVTQVSQRGDLMRAGFVVGGITFAVMVALGAVQNSNSLLWNSYLGLLNGLLSAVIAIGTLPYLESGFRITSAIRLLELSNPNHPVLRRLLMETPGTYHHSILVGNLAEAAADAIGADGLLARVGSTYHDIGKLKRPYFFVENQMGAGNPHDKISPSLSTLIITSHVKDGVELAKHHRLPDILVQFIAQHHGTNLVKFFYHRARETGAQGIQEKNFRYPGPKPQTKETAIVSLADVTEAAVRSLSKPAPGKIEGLVHKIIKDRLNDGQLDESDLTFKELDRIADAFVRVLTGIFHARVEYPENISREEVEEKRH